MVIRKTLQLHFQQKWKGDIFYYSFVNIDAVSNEIFYVSSHFTIYRSYV